MKWPAIALLLCAVTHAAVAETMAVTSTPVVIDGDTIAIGHERIRLLAVDTPESFRPRCEAELIVALQAKQRLRELLDTRSVEIERHGFDRYGRTLALVRSGGIDVGDILIAEGLAVAWRPGRAAWAERARHWCPGFTERPD